MYRKLVSEAMVVAVGKVGVALGALFGVRVLTGLLPPQIYGKLSLLLSLTLVAQYTFGSALEQTAMRFYSITQEQRSGRTYLSRLLFYWGCGVFCFSLLVLALYFFQILPLSACEAVSIFFLACIAMGLNLFFGIQSGARNRLLVACLQTVGEWGRFLLAVVFISIYAATPFAVLSAFSCAGLLVILFYVFSVIKDPLFRRRLSTAFCLSQDVSYFFVMLIGGLFTWIQVFSDRWFIAKFLCNADVGRYQALYQISYSPSLLAASFLLTVIAPILFSSVKDGKNTSRMRGVISNYNKVMVLLTVTVILIFALSWVLKGIVPHLFLGTCYRDVAEYFPWMVLAGLMFMLSQQLMLSLCAGMKIWTMLILRALTGLLAIVCYGVGVSIAGFSGAVYGGLCLSICSVLGCMGCHLLLARSYEEKK